MKCEVVRLSDICDFEGGSQPPKSEWLSEPREGYIRMLQIRDFTKTNKNATPEYVKITKRIKQCKNSDILIGRYGASVGKILTGLEGAYNVAIIKSIPNENRICKSYLRLVFLSKEFQNLLQSVCSQRAAQAGFSKDDIADFPVHLPPLEEQHRIVEFVEEEFEALEQVRKNVEKNIQDTEDLYQSILNKELTPNDTWKHCLLKDICTFYNGKAHEKNIDENGRYILINSKFIASDARIYKKTNSQLFPLIKDDIVMVMSDVPNGKALAKCFIVDANNKYSLNQRICALRNSKIDVRFLYHMVNRNKYLLSFNNGENQTNLRKEDITNMPVTIPTSEEDIKKIVQRLDYAHKMCSELNENQMREIQEVDSLKYCILEKALSNNL